MAITTYLELETHGSGTVGLSGIVQANWERLDQVFDPALSSGDASYGAVWKAVTRSANPTSEGSVICWTDTTPKPIWREGFSTIAYAATKAIDMRGGRIQQITLTGALTFLSLTNQKAGSQATVTLRADGSGPYALAFPASWVFIGAAAPASIAANKTAVLELWCSSTTDATVIARYTVQP